MQQYLVIKQVRSTIGKPEKLGKVVKSLGLRHIGHERTYKDTNCIRGMVNKVKHLVSYKIVSK